MQNSEIESRQSLDKPEAVVPAHSIFVYGEWFCSYIVRHFLSNIQNKEKWMIDGATERAFTPFS